MNFVIKKKRLIMTPRKQQILDFIKHCIQTYGFPPSIREIGEFVGLTSSSTVHTHLRALDALGKIKLYPGKERGIQVIGEPSRVEILEALLRSYRHAAEGMSFFATQNARTDAFLGVE